MITVAVGMNLQSGPFGGGNQFGHALVQELTRAGITVVYDLNHAALDLILVTEVRPWLDICAFAMPEALRYRAQHATPIILRVNECDERKDKPFKLLNRALLASAREADHTVFISAWLQQLLAGSDPQLLQKSSVIHNGADEQIFTAKNYQPWNGSGPLNVVTHHWSSNPRKGWDIYQQMDLLAKIRPDRFAFTYVGNTPPDAELRHSRVLPPLHGEKLAQELARHHVYLTASINEPAGMHHIEGASCGLPLLYRQSGALPEYCQGFGIAFNGPEDFPAALANMIKHYHEYQPTMVRYPHTAAAMAAAYRQLFQAIIAKSPAARRGSAWAAQAQLVTRLAVLRIANHLW